jgi:predicted nucleic acid-binding protein
MLLASVAISTGLSLVVTEYAARHELNSIATEIEALEGKGAVTVKAVERRDPVFRGLIKAGVHKGEAEAMAWGLSQGKALRPLFVSRDEGAIHAARARGLPATDVMGLIVEAIVSGAMSQEQARSALVVWGDPEQELCRPRDYAGFDATLLRRQKLIPDYYK